MEKNNARCSWLWDLVNLCMKCDICNLMCEIIPESNDHMSLDDESPLAVVVGLIKGIN